MTALWITLAVLIGAAIVGGTAVFFLRARMMETAGYMPGPSSLTPGPAPAPIAEEVRAIGDRIDQAMTEQRLHGETQRQFMAQKLDSVTQAVDAQRNYVDGLRGELRHEVRRRDAEMEDMRHQIATIQSVVALPEAQGQRALPEPAPAMAADELAAPMADAQETVAEDAPPQAVPTIDFAAARQTDPPFVSDPASLFGSFHVPTPVAPEEPAEETQEASFTDLPAETPAAEADDTFAAETDDAFAAAPIVDAEPAAEADSDTDAEPADAAEPMAEAPSDAGAFWTTAQPLAEVNRTEPEADADAVEAEAASEPIDTPDSAHDAFGDEEAEPASETSDEAEAVPAFPASDAPRHTPSFELDAFAFGEAAGSEATHEPSSDGATDDVMPVSMSFETISFDSPAPAPETAPEPADEPAAPADPFATEADPAALAAEADDVTSEGDAPAQPISMEIIPEAPAAEAPADEAPQHATDAAPMDDGYVDALLQAEEDAFAAPAPYVTEARSNVEAFFHAIPDDSPTADATASTPAEPTEAPDAAPEPVEAAAPADPFATLDFGTDDDLYEEDEDPTDDAEDAYAEAVESSFAPMDFVTPAPQDTDTPAFGDSMPEDATIDAAPMSPAPAVQEVMAPTVEVAPAPTAVDNAPEPAWVSRPAAHADEAPDDAFLVAPASEFVAPSDQPVAEAAPAAEAVTDAEAEAVADAETADEDGLPEGADDLTIISAIDEAMQERLYRLGVVSLDEIARWNRGEAGRIAGLLEVSEEMIMTQWIFEAQAALFRQFAQRGSL